MTRLAVVVLIKYFGITHDNVDKSLNDYNVEAYYEHISGYVTTQIFLSAGYLWPIMFRDCIRQSRNVTHVIFSIEKLVLHLLLCIQLLSLEHLPNGELTS